MGCHARLPRRGPGGRAPCCAGQSGAPVIPDESIETLRVVLASAERFARQVHRWGRPRAWSPSAHAG